VQAGENRVPSLPENIPLSRNQDLPECHPQLPDVVTTDN